VFEFVVCLTQHAKERQLSNPHYWICAYSLNQHNIVSELGGNIKRCNPKDSPFYRAMQLTKGAVSVLDRNLGCFRRIWCVYEISIVFSDLKDHDDDKREYTYDIYGTVQVNENKLGGTAIGLRDGPSSAVYEDRTLKQALLDRCREALTMRLENADSSFLKDKWMILNSIVGHTNLLATRPPKEHPAFDRINTHIRGKLAIAMYSTAIDYEAEITDFETAIHNSQLQKLEMNFDRFAKIRNHIKNFTSALPTSLQQLDLSLRHSPFEDLDEFSSGLSHLQKLEYFKLDLSYSESLAEVKPLLIEINKLQYVTEISLKLRKCSIYRFPFSASESNNLRILDIDISHNRELVSLDELGCALAVLSGLRTFRLICGNCPGIVSIERLMEGLQFINELDTLYLDFTLLTGKALTSIDGVGFAIRIMPSLSSLHLIFAGQNGISSVSDLADGLSDRSLRYLSLDFRGTDARASCRDLCSKIALTTNADVASLWMPWMAKPVESIRNLVVR
jgi:hypothetical protein